MLAHVVRPPCSELLASVDQLSFCIQERLSITVSWFKQQTSKMATNANAPQLHNTSPESSPSPEDSAEPLDNEQELDGPLLSFPLVEDVKRKDQLFGGRMGRLAPPSTPKPYRPSQNQLLGEGKGWQSEITARLNKVIFGTFKGKTACLVMVQVNFAPKSRGFFRFRNAKVELGFEDKEDGKEHKEDDEDDDDDDDDDDSDDDEQLLVLKIDPEHIRGHIQTAAVTYGVTIGGTAPPPVPVGVSGAWRFSAPREGQHLVHGLKMGDPERGVKWIINENEISKSGIFELAKFAVIVRYREERGFVMKLSMEATTHLGGALKSKGGSRISFNKGKKHQKGGKGREEEQKMSGLIGGSVASGGKTWTAETESETSHPQLDDIDLESMTEMKARLLSEQGPGGGQGRGAAAMPDEQVDAALTQ